MLQTRRLNRHHPVKAATEMNLAIDMDIHSPTNSTEDVRRQKNKKRFRDEQIKSLELLFHSESRPESQRKQQIAVQLGLEPRQVAIWFQNRRARCKSKQIEHDYSILKASYENLSAKFETLGKENQSLEAEVQRLRNLDKRPKKSRKHDSDFTDLNSNGGSLYTTSMSPANFTTGPEDSHHTMTAEDDAKTTHQYLEHYADIINMIEVQQQAYDSPTSCGNCGSLGSADCLLQNVGSEWWEALS